MPIDFIHAPPMQNLRLVWQSAIAACKHVLVSYLKCGHWCVQFYHPATQDTKMAVAWIASMDAVHAAVIFEWKLGAETGCEHQCPRFEIDTIKGCYVTSSYNVRTKTQASSEFLNPKRTSTDIADDWPYFTTKLFKLVRVKSSPVFPLRPYGAQLAQVLEKLTQ